MKNNVSNCIVFFTLLATIICSSLAQASQEAVVIVDKATVYADWQLSSPIGYISKGKTLLIGDKKRNKALVYSTVVNGRVVYVRVHDVQTKSQLQKEEKTSEKIHRKLEGLFPKWVEFRYISFASLVSNPVESDSLSNEPFALYGGGIRVHRMGDSVRKKYMMSLEYLTGTKDETTFVMYNTDIEFAYSLVISKLFRANFVTGISLIPHAQYKVPLFTKNGYGAGVLAGLEFVYNLSHRTKLHLDARYQYKQLLGFSLPDEIDQKFAPVFTGTQASLGLSYSF